MSFDTLSPRWLWRSYWSVFLLLNVAIVYRSNYLGQSPSDYFDLTLLSILMIFIGILNYLKSRPDMKQGFWLSVALFLATALIVMLLTQW